jgi:hypothetical protein
MAIGIALLLGFRFNMNFDSPYKSASITEFWRRWHISLSSWLRDYLYISLGGNRKGKIRTYINLIITMLLGGLWHGANWNFVIWGALHGFALAAHKFLKFKLHINKNSKPQNDSIEQPEIQINIDKKEKPPLRSAKQMNMQLELDFGFDKIDNAEPPVEPVKPVQQSNNQPQVDIDKNNKPYMRSVKHWLGVFFTFHFVMFAWIFFRNQSLDDCFTILSQIFTSFQPQILWQLLSGYKLVFVFILAGYILHFVSSRIENYCKNKFISFPLLLKVAITVILIYAITQIKSGDVQPFIYFQF